MTAVCGGGTSSQKPEFSQSLFISVPAIAALLGSIPAPWAAALAGYIGARTYDLSQFCPNDPPPVPNITALDVVNILNVFNPITNVPAADKLQQLVGAFLWYQVCQCDTVTTPNPPAAPAAPVGMPSIDPRLSGPSATDVVPCYVYPGPNSRDIFNTSYPQIEPFGVQSNQTGFSVEMWVTLSASGASSGITHRITQLDAAGNTIQTALLEFVAAGGSKTVFYPLLPQAVSYRVQWESPTVPTAHNAVYIQVRAYCSGERPGGTVHVCAPDTQLLAQIDQILQLVTLMQRQRVPFAYIRGAVHAGLHDQGELEVQGLIGAIVQLTTIPQYVGVESGDPLEYFEAGWINWGSADGFGKRQRINCSPQTSFPDVAGQYTRIGYTLTPGVVATITELVREP